MGLYRAVRPLVFRVDPELAHDVACWCLSVLDKITPVREYVESRYFVNSQALNQRICGLEFRNPVGIACGFDKNATLVRALASIGFGHVEVGSITRLPQSGNPKPRVFRHVQEESIQNSMGFNNSGSVEVCKNLSQLWPCGVPVGVSIGKNKQTPLLDALEDYRSALMCVKDVGNYFVFNLSSPNTVGLRGLQNEAFVEELFCMATSVTKKPTFLKVSPDMSIDDTLGVVSSAISSGATGVISTNTTTNYEVIEKPALLDGKPFGGISGKALAHRSRLVLREISKNFFGKTIIISVGGVSDSADAYRRIRMGANLVQLLSSLIYKGPSIVRTINNGLIKMVEQDGFKNITEAIGVDVK